MVCTPTGVFVQSLQGYARQSIWPCYYGHIYLVPSRLIHSCESKLDQHQYSITPSRSVHWPVPLHMHLHNRILPHGRETQLTRNISNIIWGLCSGKNLRKGKTSHHKNLPWGKTYIFIKTSSEENFNLNKTSHEETCIIVKPHLRNQLSILSPQGFNLNINFIWMVYDF